MHETSTYAQNLVESFNKNKIIPEDPVDQILAFEKIYYELNLFEKKTKEFESAFKRIRKNPEKNNVILILKKLKESLPKEQQIDLKNYIQIFHFLKVRHPELSVDNLARIAGRYLKQDTIPNQIEKNILDPDVNEIIEKELATELTQDQIADELFGPETPEQSNVEKPEMIDRSTLSQSQIDKLREVSTIKKALVAGMFIEYFNEVFS